MQTVFNLIKERRSIRRFKAQEIEEEKLTAILESARWTPSWANTQCWEIVVVQDQTLKNELSGLLSPKNPATLAIANAPITLAICASEKKSGYYKEKQATKFGDWFMYDLGLFTQTICLSAHAVGLGSVIVGLFDHEKVGQTLQLPNGYNAPVLLPIGYPDHSPSAPKRKELDQFVHYDKFRLK